MAGDIVVNIYGNDCGCGKQVDTRRRRDFALDDCIRFVSGFPRCNDDCSIDVQVEILDTRVASVEMSIELIGSPFSFCLALAPVATTGTIWTGKFFCLFCGATYRVHARGLDSSGMFICEISATVSCSRFPYEEFGKDEIAAFKKKVEAKRKELDDAILAEGKQLVERLKSKGKQGAKG